MGGLLVELRKTSTLQPYPRNPRKISDKAVAKVAASIREYGFRQPIVVDKEGVIIVGHARHLAALSLGIVDVPVHVADLSADKAAAYRLADNRTNEESGWDFAALGLELGALKDLGLDLGPLGFDEAELARFGLAGTACAGRSRTTPRQATRFMSHSQAPAPP